MKKKILIISILSVLFALVLAFSASAENKIIKLDTCPTLEEIHANPDAYISHLDEFDDAAYETYRTADSSSVVVMFDNQATPTYYVYPAYYLIRSSYWYVTGGIAKLNETIAAVNASQEGLNAFAGYTSAGEKWGKGECDYIVRVEVPTYVTTIHGEYKFEGSVNLKEVYFPVHTVIDEQTGEEKTVSYVTSVSGQNLFSSCSKLEYIHNSEYLPGALVNDNQDGFSSCSSLKEFKVPNTATSIGLRCFTGCSSLKEIIIPNSVTQIKKGAFSNCTSLEVFSFGAGFTTFVRVNVDYETFQSVNSLKFVYLPSAFKNSINATANDYQNIFNSSSAKTVYFYVGSKEDATTIRDKFKTTNANENIGNIPDANIVKYDPTVNYVDLQKTLTSSMIVYDYNLCDAFYEGEHTNVDTKCETADVCGRTCGYEVEAHTPTSIVLSYQKYNEAGKRIVTCDHEGCLGSGEFVLEPIFVTKGYSIKNDGCGIVAGYDINIKALEEYETAMGDIEIGIIMANSSFDENAGFMTKGEGDKYTLNSSYGVQLKITSRDYSRVNSAIVNFTTAESELKLVMALYVVDGKGVSYIQHKGQGPYADEVKSAGVALDVVTISNIATLTGKNLQLPEAKALPVENKENQ